MKTRSAITLVAALVAACTSPAPAAAPTATAATPTVALTPAGTSDAWITYEWFADGDEVKSIFLARPDGSDAHVIAADVPGELRGPAWSPHGNRIAFVKKADAAPDGSLWTMAPDGTDAKQLFDPTESCPGGAYWPAYSPDGGRIAFVCYQLDSAAITVIDLSTLEITPLHAGVLYPDHLDNPPSWSPDGKTIVFDLEHWDPTGESLDGSRLGTVPAAGGDVTWLTELEGFAAWADWHPTDDLIVYNTYDLGNMHEVDQPSNLFTMRSDGSQVEQLTDLTNPRAKRVAQARWLPDGSGLIASCAYGNPVSGVQICLVDPSTGEITYQDHILSGARPDLQPFAGD